MDPSTGPDLTNDATGSVFRSLFEKMPLGAVVQSANGQILAANPAAERILGVSMESLLGRTSEDRRWEAIREDGSPFPGDEHPAMVALRTGTAIREPVLMGILRPGDEVRRWIEVMAVPLVPADGGQPDRVYAIFSDVTERRRAEEALRESEERFHLALEGVDEALWDLRPSTSETYFSPRWFTMLGYAPDEFPPTYDTWAELLHPEDRPRAEKTVAEFVDTGGDAFALEFRLRAKDGSWRWIASRGRTVSLDESGRVARVVGTHVDITSRKIAERALRRSEGILRSLVQASPMGMHLYELTADDRLVLIDANPAADRMTGIDTQALVGQTIEEAFPALVETEVPERYRLAARDGVPWQTRSLFYEDEKIRGAFDVHAFQISAGRMAVVFLDVTERTRHEANQKRLSEELRETSTLLETVLDAIPDIIGVQDREHRILRYNEAGYAFLGKTPKETHGRPCYEAIGRDDECEECATSRTIETGEPARVVRHLKEIDRWLDVRSYPVHDEAGRVVQVVEHLRDITREQHAEAALARSEEMFRSYFRRGLIGMAVISTSRRWVDTNDRLCGMLAYTREQLRETTWDELFYPADRPKQLRDFERLLAGEIDEATTECRFVCRDGTLVLAQQYLTCVRRPEGEEDFVIGHFQDITEHRRAEETLRQAQKMEAVGQLAGGVAHDFNNLLQAIRGYTEIALGKLPAGDPLRDHLDEVEKAASRATGLTRQLLTFSRRETLRPVHLDLGEVVSDLLKMLRRIIGEHVELIVDSAPDLRTVFADRGQIELVLMNLCLNARDAMKQGGILTIETAGAHLDDGVYVALTVCDTGVGIPDEIRDRIFEPFFTTKETGEGTGLGLATVYAIVQRNRGRIDIETTEGEGTSFRVLLPVSERPAGTEDEEPEEPGPETGSETILVAEDDELVRNLAVTILEGAGYRLIIARDGEEAIRLFHEHEEHVDLLLLDVVMPHRSGRDVLDVIRAEGHDVPVLFCSGYSYSALEKGQLPAGGPDLLQKPYTPRELLRRVRKALGSPTDG